MLFVSDSTDCLFVCYSLFVLFTAVVVVSVGAGVLEAFVNCYGTVVRDLEMRESLLNLLYILIGICVLFNKI